MAVVAGAGAGMTTLPGMRYALQGSAAGRAMSSQRAVLDDAANPALSETQRSGSSWPTRVEPPNV